MRDEAIADLSLRSEGELRQSEKCGASGMAAGGGDTNYQEFLQQRGAIITALLPTGDTNYQEFLQQRGAIITALLPTGRRCPVLIVQHQNHVVARRPPL